MLNFAERTGSGVFILIWPILVLQPSLLCYKQRTNECNIVKKKGVKKIHYKFFVDTLKKSGKKRLYWSSNLTPLISLLDIWLWYETYYKWSIWQIFMPRQRCNFGLSLVYFTLRCNYNYIKFVMRKILTWVWRNIFHVWPR